MRRTLRILLAVAVAAPAAGCGQGRSPKTPPSPPPCATNPASSVELGIPPFSSAPLAPTIETTGATLYLVIRDLAHEGVFDPAYPAQSYLDIGPAATPPHYERSDLTPLTTQVVLTEDRYRQLDLPAGRYWLLTSDPGPVTFISCSPGAVTGTPAPSPSATLTPTTQPSPSHS